MLSSFSFKICIALALSCFAPLTESQQQFCYDDDACGPKSANWSGICQTGKNQSPVDIKTSTADNLGKKNVSMSRALCDDIHEFNIENDGKTIEITLTSEQIKKRWHYVLRGEGYTEDYTFLLIDFHWGKTDEEGAQHTIDGKKFALEMHIVGGFYPHQAPHGDNPVVAANKSDSLSILCVLFEIGDADNPDLEPIIKAIPHVRDKARKDFSGSTKETLKPTIKDKLNILKLIPEKKEVYRYQGSVDIPNPDFGAELACAEIAIWDIFSQPLKVSKKQMTAFRSIQKPDGTPVLVNSRPVQELRDQKIQKIEWNFKCKTHFRNCY